MEEDVQIKPAFKEKNVPVVFNADNNYVNYVKVMLHSLIKHTTKENNYDLIFFNRNITEENQNSIINMAENYKNISIRFIDINPIIKNLELKLINYYSEEIYFRLFMPYILKEYDKAIYLDCDLVLCEDIANLYTIDIGDNLVGAVRDIGMILWYYKKERPKTLKYIDTVLKDININEYFNSGVMVLNLDEFRKSITKGEIISLIKSESWEYPDQDVLNVICKDRITILPAKWNVIPEIPSSRSIIDICKYVPQKYGDEYVESREKASIVHYELNVKPWKHTRCVDQKLFDMFWDVASETDVFRQLLLELARNYSVSEAYSIYTKYFNKDNLKIVESVSNIFYILDDTILYDLANSPVIRYDNVEFNNNLMTLEGSIPLANFVDIDQIEVYFKVNEDFIKCDKFIYRTYPQYKNQVMDSCLRFKGVINLESSDRLNVGFYIKYRDKLINLNRIRCHWHFILNETYTKQYYYNNGRIFYINGNQIHIEKANKLRVIKKELAYLKYLKQRNTSHDNEAILLRTIYHIVKTLKRKPIWLVADNFLADSNGVPFFRYLQQRKDKKCRAYFIIEKNHAKYKEIKKMKNVIILKSKKHKFLSLLADTVMSSVSTKYSQRYPFESKNYACQDILSKQKFVYLQHGVITQDCTKFYNKYYYFPTTAIVIGKPEYDSIISNPYYYHKPEEIWITGYPRCDYLYNAPKKYITIMPTWRESLLLGEKKDKEVANFEESKFYKYYNALLNDERLHQRLEESGYKLCLSLHPLFRRVAPYFENSKGYFTILDEVSKDVIAWSNLVVTDYSSVIFDFLYLRKPIIYTQPDKEEFFANHVYEEGDFDYEKDGFGEVEYTIEETVDRIIEYVENDCKLKDKYRKRVENFYAFNDKNNCQRLYEKIIELEKKG